MISPLNGVTYEMDIPMEKKEFDRRFIKWRDEGTLLQDEFPELDSETREFILTGIPPEEWDRIFLDKVESD